MLARIETLADAVDLLQVAALEYLTEHLQGEFRALTQLVDVSAGFLSRDQPHLQAVFDGQQLGRELLDSIFMGLLEISLTTATQILDLRTRPEKLIPVFLGLRVGLVELPLPIGLAARRSGLAFRVRGIWGFALQLVLGHPFGFLFLLRHDVVLRPAPNWPVNCQWVWVYSSGLSSRDFNALPSNRAVISTIGMTRS